MSDLILFNGLKHHRQSIQEFIQMYAIRELPLLSQALTAIGNSQMDLYLGNLTETEIFTEVLLQLTRLEALHEEAYRQFLQPHHYQTIDLCDGSRWVLRLGKHRGQYIHIHPGRYSPHTLRVKATTLKTAIAVQIWHKEHPEPLDTVVLNRLRKETLGLSPVRTLSEVQTVTQLIQVLTDHR